MKRIEITTTLEVPDPITPAFCGQRVQMAVEDYAEQLGWKLIDLAAKDMDPLAGRYRGTQE